MTYKATVLLPGRFMKRGRFEVMKSYSNNRGRMALVDLLLLSPSNRSLQTMES